MRRLVHLGNLLVFTIGMAFSQEPEFSHRNLFPIPEVGQRATLKSAGPARYVLLDPKTMQLVVSYPPGLGAQGGGEYPPEATTYRVELAVNIVPLIKAEVSVDDQGGVYSYSYVLHNRADAKQSIFRLNLSLPSFDSIQDVRSPEGWHHDTFSPDSNYFRQLESFKSQGWNHQLDQDTRKNRFQWFATTENSPAAPGGTGRAFGFTSTYRPGLLFAYMQGPSAITVPSDPPPEVGEQLFPFMFDEFNSVSLPTIGPKFSPDTDDLTIANDYIAQLAYLSTANPSVAKSALVGELLEELRKFVAEPHADVKPPGAGVKRKATNQFERQLVAAMELSLKPGESRVRKISLVLKPRPWTMEVTYYE